MKSNMADKKFDQDFTELIAPDNSSRLMISKLDWAIRKTYWITWDKFTWPSITSAAFTGDDLVFTKDDSTTVTLLWAKTSLKGDKWATWATGATWPQWPAWATGATWPQWPAGTNWTNGTNWVDGADWVGIASVTSNKVGKTTTVTVTKTDTTTSAFNILDWADWIGSGDMLKATYDPTNINADAFSMDNMVETATKKILTATERTNLGNQSWSNTGDETATTIKTKLGITTLSGSNTGDNATNSQYSGLATSKQDTLVSGTNIKTINSTSILWSGDITISWGWAYRTAITGTRTGNNTFTLVGDQSSLISRGTVVKWTESSTPKQAMVITSVYSTTTLVTLVGDTMTSIDASSLKYWAVKAKELTFAYLPTVWTGTDIMGRWFAGEKTKVHWAIAYHWTAGTTNATTYDCNKNWTTIFTTKISVASGATVGSDISADTTSYLDTNDYLTIDCDSVSTTAPVYATIKVFVSPFNDIFLS